MTDNYRIYVEKKQKEKAEKLNKIIQSKNGIWKNIDEYNGMSFICKISCKYNHDFQVHSRNIEAKGTWCPFCSGNLPIGETLCRIILEELLGFSLEKTRRIIGLKCPDSKSPLEIDGYNFKRKIGFEYQGHQHFEYIPHIHKTEANFIKLKNKDEFKKKFCDMEGIKMIYINQIYNLDPLKLIDKLIIILKNEKIEFNEKASRNEIINRIEKTFYLGIYYEKINKFLNENKLELIEGNFKTKACMLTVRIVDYNEIIRLKINKIFKIIDSGINVDAALLNMIYLKKNKHNINKKNIISDKMFRWDVVKAKAIIDNCKNTKELYFKSKGLVFWLMSKGLYKELTKDLKRLTTSDTVKKYSYNELLAEAKKHNTREEFKLNSRVKYEQSRKNKIIDQICDHMIYDSNNKKYTDTYLIDFAKKYDTKAQIRKANGSIYTTIRKRNLQSIAFAHCIKKEKLTIK